MAISNTTFQTSALAPFLSTAIDRHRQKRLKIYAKAVWLLDGIGNGDYVTTDAKALQLVTDARKYLGYLQTNDAVTAAKIWAIGVANGTITHFDSTTRIRRSDLWSPLPDETLDQMDVLLDYFITGNT